MKQFLISLFLFLIQIIITESKLTNKFLHSSNSQNIITSLLSFNNLNSFSQYGIHYLPEDESKEKTNLRGKLFKILRDFVEERNISKANISKSCENVINKYLFGKYIYDKNISSTNISYIISDYNIIKLLDDSSKNRNNLGTYDQCMYKTYKFWKLLNQIDGEIYEEPILENKIYSTYVILSIDKNGSLFRSDEKNENVSLLELDFNYSLQGYCFPQGYKNEPDGEYCSDEDYKNFIIYYNEQFADIFLLNNSRVEVFTLKQNPIESEKSTPLECFIKLLPLVFFCFLFLLMVIYHIYTKCKCCKNEEINEIKIEEYKDDINEGRISDFGNKQIINQEKNINYKKSKFSEIIECFNFVENTNELFSFSKNSTKYNNDSGLNYIRGLLGFSTIFIVVGFTFIVAYNSPTKVSSPNQLSDFFSEDWLFYLIIMVGIRYSPRIILSCSGYLLSFKYVSYLDRNYIKNSESMIKSFFKFLSFQLHKFILLIILILFERFSAYEISSIINYITGTSDSPTYKYLKKYIVDKPGTDRFLFSLILIGLFLPNKDEQYRNGHHLLMYFWLPFNEIIFFLIGIIIISLGFKFKLRIDIIILCLIPLLYGGKILYSYLISDYYKNGFDGELTFPVNECYPTLFYVFFNYGRDMIYPVFNLSYYLIGMYFGLINYTIQKGINKLYKSNKVKSFITKEEMEGLLTKFDEGSSDLSSANSDDNEKEEIVDKSKEKVQKLELREEFIDMPFLMSPVKLVIWHRNLNKKFIKIIIFILLFVFVVIILSVFLFNIFSLTDSFKDIFTHPFINLIYRIDIELVIFFAQWSFFYLIQIRNDSLDFLSNIIWITLSRPYFSFILVINTTLLFIFYHDEALIEINSISILMHSLMGGWFTFLMMSLFYILFELPLKRVTRVFYNLNNDIKEKDLDEKIENDNSEDYDEDNNDKIKSD